MTLARTQTYYLGWYIIGAILFTVFGLLPITMAYFLPQEAEDGRSVEGGLFGLIGLASGIVTGVYARRYQNFGEFLYIDENEVRLHFRRIQCTIPMSSVDRFFEVSDPESTRYVIKTLDGQKYMIPDAQGLYDFVHQARKKYNFKLQESKQTNFKNL